MEAKQNIILAFVGMPGAGKSEAAKYLEQKGIPFVRFGDLTDEGLKKLGLELNPENERLFRENIRKELGMAAYAIQARPKIEDQLSDNQVTAIDGLYSWEEYTYLKDLFPQLILIHIYAEPKKRYERLAHREIRPVPYSEARKRDITELERLNKGGPIAIADYMLENDAEIDELKDKINELLERLGISL